MVQQLDELCRQAQHNLQQGQPQIAASLVQRVLAERPDHFEAGVLLGLSEAALGDVTSGLSRLRPLVAPRPDAIGFYRLLGDMLLQSGADLAALALYDESLAVRPSPESWTAKARALTRQVNGQRIGIYVEIAEAARQAVALDDNSAWEAHYLLGLALGWQSRHEEAEPELRRTHELRPDHPDALRRLAKIVIERGDFAQARPLWEALTRLVPSDAEAREALATCSEAEKPEKAGRKRMFGRTPTTIESFADLEKAIRDTILPEYRGMEPIIGRQTRLMAMGSCFAGNVARVLESLGTRCTYLGLGEEVNSTFANRALFDWIGGGGGAAANRTLESLFPDGRQRFPALFREADIIIYTLGVAPCFFDRATGEFLLADGQPTSALALARKAQFRTTTVAENVDNLRAIVAAARRLNPSAQFVFTVSPVSLAASFERASAVIADCVSKSVLRVAIEEFLAARLPGTYYWPAFEIVRWLGAFHPGMYGEEDGSTLHVSERVVTTIMKLFLEIFGQRELAAQPSGAA